MTYYQKCEICGKAMTPGDRLIRWLDRDGHLHTTHECCENAPIRVSPPTGVRSDLGVLAFVAAAIFLGVVLFLAARGEIGWMPRLIP